MRRVACIRDGAAHAPIANTYWDCVADVSDQARANKPSTGPLQKKLDAQKKQTRSNMLKDIADEELKFRQAENNAKASQYN